MDETCLRQITLYNLQQPLPPPPPPPSLALRRPPFRSPPRPRPSMSPAANPACHPWEIGGSIDRQELFHVRRRGGGGEGGGRFRTDAGRRKVGRKEKEGRRKVGRKRKEGRQVPVFPRNTEKGERQTERRTKKVRVRIDRVKESRDDNFTQLTTDSNSRSAGQIPKRKP